MIEDLQERVAKATEKVEKCKKTISRHEAQLEKKLKTGDVWEIKWKRDDIQGATRKLKEAEIVLDNWTKKLNVAIERERFLEGNAPQVIKDFLENWKQVAYEWHVKRYNDYQIFKVELKEAQVLAQIEYIESNPDKYARHLDDKGKLMHGKLSWIVSIPDRDFNKYLKDKELDYSNIQRREMLYAGQAVLHMDSIYKEEERLAWLERTLEREKKAKMFDLIQRINAVVGTITDATGLRISPKGNLDGVVIGEKGRAKIETIGAGGWNIQCFHFRTLVHKID